MGQDFYYANLDRKQYFDVGLGFQANKQGGVGRNFGARALGLLLLERVYPQTDLPGTWAQQRVVVMSNQVEGGLHESMGEDFRDIGSAVLMMLFESDRKDLIEAARVYDGLFVRLGEMAVVHGEKGVAATLERAFGSDWKRKHGLLRREMSSLVIPPP